MRGLLAMQDGFDNAGRQKRQHQSFADWTVCNALLLGDRLYRFARLDLVQPVMRLRDGANENLVGLRTDHAGQELQLNAASTHKKRRRKNKIGCIQLRNGRPY